MNEEEIHRSKVSMADEFMQSIADIFNATWVNVRDEKENPHNYIGHFVDSEQKVIAYDNVPIRICLMDFLIKPPFPAQSIELSPLTQNMLVFAARYAHGRQTGAALQVMTEVGRNVKKLSNDILEQLRKESHEASCNLEDWDMMRNFIEQEQKTRRRHAIKK